MATEAAGIDAGASATPDAGTDAAPSGNLWQGLTSRLGELLAPKGDSAPQTDAATPRTPTAKAGEGTSAEGDADEQDAGDDTAAPAPTPDDDEDLDEETPDEQGEAEDEGDDDADDEEAGKEEGKEETPKPETAKPEGGKPPRFTIADKDGQELELDALPEGAVIRFKASGRDVEVKSVDELVGLAQKGADYDRQGSELGQRVATVRREAQATEATLREELTQAEEILLKAVFDPEARKALEAELAPYRDPAVREAFAAQEREQQRQATEQRQQTATHEQVRDQFWTKVTEELTSYLPTTSHLDATDAPRVVERFWQGFEATLAASKQEAHALAKSQGWTAEQADAIAEQHALGYLTEDNLRATAAALNGELATRFEPKKKAAPAPATPDPKKAAREAEHHNVRVQKKLAQRAQPRTLRGGGAAPGASTTPSLPENASFADKMAAMKRELRNA